MAVSGFQWFPVVGALVALLTFLANLPAIAKHWREENRLIDKIDRNTKAISAARSESTIAALNETNSKLALRFAALQLFPFPRWALIFVNIAQIIILCALLQFVLLFFYGFNIWGVLNSLLTYSSGFALNLLAYPRMYRIDANRVGYVWSGGPAKFRTTNYAYTGIKIFCTPFPLALAFMIRIRIRGLEGDFPKSLSNSQTEAYRVWNNMLDTQDRYYTIIKKRNSRKPFSSIRRRAWRIRLKRLIKYFSGRGEKADNRNCAPRPSDPNS
ncbi:Uncharacterised protein [Mycobacteroides abscessus subsp. bolletii]|uniref:hypothetical protein n=1 Tax=Mycobacteroides abscessus TaxID=36809 RepID=UPI0009CA0119|nr:hypothetical protein [Mycobacteroides abscessus]SKF99257.1 Uncharacterised protein [Mycobacteroides abscessus subsp. bolletii]SKG34904.1 Uncharacterised protein [Mycobacteroides abscessus subsp. bolletii]